MEMIWHYDKFVQKVCAFVPASKNSLNQQFRCVRHSEKFASLPRG